MSLFTNPIFTEGILPFLLVFVLIFAILQRSKILGEGQKQIDSLVSLTIALILIGFETPRTYIVQLLPWLAVALVVLLIFMLVYGMVGETTEKGLKLPVWVRNAVLWLAIIFVVVIVFKITDTWDTFYNWVSSSSVIGNILMIVVVVVVLWIALRDPDKESKSYSLNNK